LHNVPPARLQLAPAIHCRIAHVYWT